MKHLAVRLVLVLGALAAMGAAGVEVWRIERDKDGLATSARQVDDRFRRLMLAIADIRAQQQAYVAAGQANAFWADKVTQVLGVFDKQTAELRPSVRSADAQAALDSAAGAIDTFRKMDARAREYAQSGQELLASDLIFTDGFETTQSALSQVDAARNAESLRVEADIRRFALVQGQWIGGAAGIAVLILLALMPRAHRPRDHQDETAQHAGLRIAPQRATDLPEPYSDAVLIKDTPRAPEAPRAEPTPDLLAAADVCAGLACVLETAELTALLGRAAQVLNAAGIIVWVADRSGAELRPALSYGYSNQVLARMGVIPRDAHNAVATAYRTGATRIVSGDGRHNGAIVAPIVSPGGCLGALAAEVRLGAERNTAIKALALVFAAQLGTLVGSVPSDAAMSPVQSLATS